MKTLVLLLLLSLAAVAAAGTDDSAPCMLGMPIAKASRIFRQVDGISPNTPPDTRERTCGGGLDHEGRRIKPYPCLTQVWTMQNTGNELRIQYMKPDDVTGPWLVNYMAICKSGGHACEAIDVMLCRWHGDDEAKEDDQQGRVPEDT